MNGRRFLAYTPDNLNVGLSVVYFLQGSSGLIRIGTTSRLHRRIHEAMIGNDRPVVLVGALCGDGYLKREFHARFAEYRSHGEWFRPVNEVVDFIEENRDHTFREVFEATRNTGSGRREVLGEVVDMSSPIKEKDVNHSCQLSVVVMVPLNPLLQTGVAQPDRAADF